MEKKAARKKRIPKEARIPANIKINRRREWRLDLPLKAIIEGRLPHGEKFKESTTLENISSTGAYFCLDSGLVVGSKLNLIIDVPRKLTEGKTTHLLVGGITVRLERQDRKTKKQGVAVRFRKNFKFLAPGK